MFNFNANYDVNITTPTTARSLTVGRGNVRLNLASSLLLNFNLSIGRSTGPRSSLIVSGGTLLINTAFIGGSSTVASGLGSLVLDNAARVQIANDVRIWSTGVIELRETSDSLLLPGTLFNSGTIDLTDNAMVATNMSLAAIDAQIRNARHNGAWDQPGITSSSARNDASNITTLGAITGVQRFSTNSTTFHGHNVAATDVLVQYTLYGDSDFNGIVNFDDYARIDSGFNNQGTGAGADWFHGDFDLNGVVNFDDYSLIDLAFNTQSLPQMQAVPEPAALLSIAVSLAGCARLHLRRADPTH
jgi:hypothetical protein